MDFPKDFLENTSPKSFYVPSGTSEQNIASFNRFYQNFVPPNYVHEEVYLNQIPRGSFGANYDIRGEPAELKDNTNEASNIKTTQQQQQKEVSIFIEIGKFYDMIFCNFISNKLLINFRMLLIKGNLLLKGNLRITILHKMNPTAGKIMKLIF